MGLASLLNLKQGVGAGSLTKLSSVLSTSVSFGVAKESPVAIDFGTGALKVLQVEAGDPPGLVAAACLETPAPLIRDHKRRLAFQFEALPKLIKKCGFRGKRAVCSIPAWRTQCKHLQFPRAEGVPLGAMVEAAISQQMHVDPASLVYRFVEVSSVERGGGKADVVLLAVTRDVVDNLMTALVAAKLQPVGMHSEFLCILKAFDHLHRRDGDLKQNSLYLDVGSTTTKVIIAHGKDMVFARTIDVGGYHLDHAIAEQLALTEEQAHKARLELDTSIERLPPQRGAPIGAAPAAEEEERRKGEVAPGFSGDVLSQPTVAVAPSGADVTEALEILTDEVRLCLRYHASQFPSRKVDRVVFVGGEARHRGLAQHVARALRLPAQVADPLARLGRTGKEPVAGIDMKEAQPGWAVALGLCLAPTDL